MALGYNYQCLNGRGRSSMEGAPPPGTVLQIDSPSGKRQQTLLSKPSADSAALEANLATGQRLLNAPSSVHPGTPCSAPRMLKSRSASPWQWGDKERAAKGSVSDGRRHAQPTDSCVRTKFSSTSLHQRQVPLPAHPCLLPS